MSSGWNTMRIGLCILLALVVPLVCAAADQGARVEYVGGTRPDIANDARGVVQAIDEHYFVFYGKRTSIRVRYDKINLLEYGQKVDRRYAMAVLISPVLLLSRRRQHFLTVGYIDDHGHEQALIFRVDKKDIRAILVSLEARTGRRVEYQDMEARQAGKG
jgi:hypothetical protein